MDVEWPDLKANCNPEVINWSPCLIVFVRNEHIQLPYNTNNYNINDVQKATQPLKIYSYYIQMKLDFKKHLFHSSSL